MRVLVHTDEIGGIAMLTTVGTNGDLEVVLVIETEDVRGVFAPMDEIDASAVGRGDVLAADVIAGWAFAPERTKEEINAARRFLDQWPDGPQL